MNIARYSDAATRYEYGCDLRRLFPWHGVANPLWGGAIASVRPNEQTLPHSHDEEEAFIILSGGGDISIDEETASVERGDVIYLPRNSHHTIRNTSVVEPLEFLTIFWGSPEANSRMIEMARAHATAGSAL